MNQNPFNLDALEQGGVEVSIAPTNGAVFVEGDTCKNLVELAGEIKDLSNELSRMKASVIAEVKPAWYKANQGAETLQTAIPVCDDTGTEIKVIATGKVKPIPFLGSKGDPNPVHGVLSSIMEDTSSCYRVRENFEFSLEAVPEKDRDKVKAYLASLGVVPKRVLVPLEHMHLVGRIPAGPDSYLAYHHQQKLEDAVGARTFSVRTK